MVLASPFILTNSPERLMHSFSARKSTESWSLFRFSSIRWFIFSKNTLSVWLAAMELMETVGICENFCLSCRRSSSRFLMQASRYCRENGFSMYASAPQFILVILASVPVLAVSRMNGIWLVIWLLRTALHRSIPFMCGIIQSLIINDTSCSFNLCSASVPSVAVTMV